MNKNRKPEAPASHPTLADSWLDGLCADAGAGMAVRKTQDELKGAGITEAQARAVREELQGAFNQWRAENPKRLALRQPVGLLGRSTSNLECRPFADYAGFFTELLAVGCRPLSALFESHGLLVNAALVLSEAAAGRFDSARTIRESMDGALLGREREAKARALKAYRESLPDAERGRKSKEGYLKRADQVDKGDFQALAEKHRDSIRTVADLQKFSKLVPYSKKYQLDALRSWLREIGITLKPGRPKKVG